MLGRIFRIITGTGCPICGGRIRIISHCCVTGDKYICTRCGAKLKDS